MPAFSLPPAGRVDPRLIAGAAVFGVGWGLAGLCPGPAITVLASGKPIALTFVGAMVTGMALARAIVAGIGGDRFPSPAVAGSRHG